MSWIESFPDVPLEGSGVKGTDIGPRRENKSKRFQAQKNRQVAIRPGEAIETIIVSEAFQGFESD